MAKDKEKLDINEKNDDMDFEARNNLVGFFDLLLRVDKRVNPSLYNKSKTYD